MERVVGRGELDNDPPPRKEKKNPGDTKSLSREHTQLHNFLYLGPASYKSHWLPIASELIDKPHGIFKLY